MRTPEPNNDMGAALAMIVATGGCTVDAIMAAMNPAPRLRAPYGAWARTYAEWQKRFAMDRAAFARLVTELYCQGYIGVAVDRCVPTDKGRALVDGWA